MLIQEPTWQSHGLLQKVFSFCVQYSWKTIITILNIASKTLPALSFLASWLRKYCRSGKLKTWGASISCYGAANKTQTSIARGLSFSLILTWILLWLLIKLYWSICAIFSGKPSTTPKGKREKKTSFSDFSQWLLIKSRCCWAALYPTPSYPLLSRLALAIPK